MATPHWQQYLAGPFVLSPELKLIDRTDAGLPPEPTEAELLEQSTQVVSSRAPLAPLGHGAFGEQLRHALALSSLLIPGSAGEPYPRPASLESSTTTRLPVVQKSAARMVRTPLAWELGWEQKGEWDLLGWGWIAFCWLCAFLRPLGPTPTTEPTPPSPTSIDSTLKISSETEFDRAKVLVTVDIFVRAAQECDAQVVRAMNALREIEGVLNGLGLSTNSTDSTSLASPFSTSSRQRVPSPLGFAPTSLRDDALRNLDLRRILSEALLAVALATSQAHASLREITGAEDGPTELDRHEAEAARDREQATLRASLSSSTGEATSLRDKRRTWDGNVGALPGSTSSKRTSFVGDRAELSSLLSPPSGTPRRSSSLLLRSSGRVRPRPLSLSVHPSQPSPLEAPPSTPPRTRSRPAESGLTTHELQAGLDNLHAQRRAFLWRILALLDLDAAPVSAWFLVDTLLAHLADEVSSAASDVGLGVEAEFGAGGLGSEAFLGGRSSFSSSYSERPRVRGGSRSRPVSWTSSAGSAFSPSYSEVTSFPPSTSSSLPFLNSNNFAPSNPTPSVGPTASLSALANSSRAMIEALRSVAAKLHVVDRHARTVMRAGGDAEGALATHDSIRVELEKLGREWAEGRIALRGALRRETTRPTALQEAEEDGLGSSIELQRETEFDKDHDDEQTLFFSSPERGEARAALLDAHSSAFLPPAGLEELFESVSSPAMARPSAAVAGREARIRLAKERRAEGGGGKASAKGLEKGMVQELKDVLQLLKERNRVE